MGINEEIHSDVAEIRDTLPVPEERQYHLEARRVRVYVVFEDDAVYNHPDHDGVLEMLHDRGYIPDGVGFDPDCRNIVAFRHPDQR
jgi:hypothetical protein